MNRKIVTRFISLALCTSLLIGCGAASENATGAEEEAVEVMGIVDNQRLVPEWAKASAIYEVNIRQYTKEGTFLAFAEHLDEVKAMGIDVIWLMPIHPISVKNRSGLLGSYYSITDYCEVNPEFGTKEDFKQLVDMAHEKGMYVMLDWVANHTGWDSQWIVDHPDWYTQNDAGQIISPENMGWPDVADLNYDNSDMRAEMINCMSYWVKEFDIDGYRCDYAGGVPVDFWESAREELNKIKPLYMLAEDGETTSLLNSAFEVNYNLDLYSAMVAAAHGSKGPDKLKLYIGKNYPEGTFEMNFLDNHDMNSYEGTIVENFGLETLPTFFTYIYTIPGVPLVYTGNEIALDHAIAFMEKDTVDWSSSDTDLRPLLSKLGEIRKSNQALYCGNYGAEAKYIDLGNSNLVCFVRESEDNSVLVLINLSKNEIALDDVSMITDAFDLNVGTVELHGGPESNGDKLIENGMTVSPWEYFVVTM